MKPLGLAAAIAEIAAWGAAQSSDTRDTILLRFRVAADARMPAAGQERSLPKRLAELAPIRDWQRTETERASRGGRSGRCATIRRHIPRLRNGSPKSVAPA